jgi:hypothetical protein
MVLGVEGEGAKDVGQRNRIFVEVEVIAPEVLLADFEFTIERGLSSSSV